MPMLEICTINENENEKKAASWLQRQLCKSLMIIKANVADHNLTTRFKFTKEIIHH